MKTSNRKTRTLLTAMTAAAALTAFACGHDEESVDGEICEHHISGPSQAITAATSSGAASLPDAAVEHTRVDIALPGSGSGFVAFEVGEAGEYIFALDPAVPLEVHDASGAKVDIEKTENGSTECTEVKVKHTLDLAVGRHTLRFGPSTEMEVRLVHEEAGEDHDHD